VWDVYRANTKRRRATGSALTVGQASILLVRWQHRHSFASPAMSASIQNRRAALPPQTVNFATLASTALIGPLLRAPDVLQARFRLLKDPRPPTAAFFVRQVNTLQSMRRPLALIVPWAHTPPSWDRRLLHRVSSADRESTYLQRAQVRRACV